MASLLLNLPEPSPEENDLTPPGARLRRESDACFRRAEEKNNDFNKPRKGFRKGEVIDFSSRRTESTSAGLR